MRDRLVELINQIDFDYCEECVCASEDGYKGAPDLAEFFADRLLAEGVIVPPCKVGDRLYEIVKMPKHTFISEFPMVAEPQQIIYKNILGGHSCIPFDQLGKTVFLTREEAERALERREE